MAPAKKVTAKKTASAKKTIDTERSEKRRYLSQEDVPSMQLSEALRIARAIADNYGKAPTKPLRVAQAIDMTHTSGPFRALCGASIAFGLTDGGAYADLISLTALGRRIVAPTADGDDLVASREAFLRPRIVREFLTKYNNSKLPSETIAKNVLEEMGVPTDKCLTVYELIKSGASDVGFIQENKGHSYVDLESNIDTSANKPAFEKNNNTDSIEETPYIEPTSTPAISANKSENTRVFITHGSNKDIVNQLKELLTFGKFTPVVAIEQESISKPVPDKVMDDMRTCYAAIIHVGAELNLMDSEGKQHVILNQNVLIEIGAAMALYRRNFILLVENGVKLPSNLQGLYEVRYEGQKLDYDSTMKLLKAFNDFRS